MDSGTSTGGPDVSTPEDPEALREEIEETRHELGETVEALAHKTDVKAQVTEQIDQTKAQVADRIDHTRESVSQKTSEFATKAKDISPDSALNAASGAAQKGRENPVPVAAIGAFALGFLIGRMSSR
jgi:methyl-accepting chemotaxis protein